MKGSSPGGGVKRSSEKEGENIPLSSERSVGSFFFSGSMLMAAGLEPTFS